MSNHTQRYDTEEIRQVFNEPSNYFLEDGVPYLTVAAENEVIEHTQRLVLEGQISELDALFPDTDSGFAGQIHELVVAKRKAKLQSQLDKLNGDRES